MIKYYTMKSFKVLAEISENARTQMGKQKNS